MENFFYIKMPGKDIGEIGDVLERNNFILHNIFQTYKKYINL